MASASVQLTPCQPVDAEITPPGSKSITNRALVCAALANGKSTLTGVLHSEDTEVMINAWKQLGVSVETGDSAYSLVVEGCGGVLSHSDEIHDLFVANSGTTIRFLTAALSACQGRFRLDGIERMRERPIGDLIRGLSQLGGDVQSANTEQPDCPPIEINSTGLAGGKATISGAISSQFLSGILMAAPLAQEDVTLEVEGELVSVPYVDMTLRVMEAFGAESSGEATTSISITTDAKYRGCQYPIEPDASAASYFWAAAAITGGRAKVNGLSRKSLQGDVAFCDVLQQMGCEVRWSDDSVEVIGTDQLAGCDVDMANISDTVQTLAAVALFAEGPTRVRGVAHNRVKETDRIGDLARELRKLGAEVEEFEDGMKIDPPSEIGPAAIETYNDHRMAMSLALVGLRVPGVVIRDPDCTRKTYPDYWEDLEAFSGCVINRSN